MRFIGITGGVGAGKSAILSYLANKPKTKVLVADEIAHQLMEPGSGCYKKIKEAFAGEDIYDVPEKLESGKKEVGTTRLDHSGIDTTDYPFHRGKLAQVIFSQEDKRQKMNGIVHPAVKDYVRDAYAKEIEKGELDYLFLEAALLIEEKYDELCDELWYIYTNEANRRVRLKESRGYSDEKIDQIMASQKSETEFRNATKCTIDNNGPLEETFRQIEEALEKR